MKRLLFFVLVRFALVPVAVTARLRAFLLPRSKPDRRRTVVVFANDGMGDNLYRIPFYAALRRCYPMDDYRLVVFVLPGMVSMFRRIPFFDEVRTAELYSHKLLLWPFVGYVRWSVFHRIDVWINLVRIRSVGYDFARQIARPSFSCAYDTALLSLCLPEEAAFQRVRMDRAYSLLLRSSISKNLRDDYRDILRVLPFRAHDETLTDVDAAFLVEEGFDIGSLGPKYAVFVPGAASAYRRWPVERFAAVAREILSNSPKLRIAVVGTKSEAHLGEAITLVSPARVTNLCGRTSLPQLGKVLSRASLVLSNETGTAHYAARLGVRTVCILGGGDFNSYFPMPDQRHVTSVFRQKPCFGCSWFCKCGSRCGSVAPCIDEITIDDVESAVSDSLRRGT